MNPDRFQRSFLARIGDVLPFREILDLLPDTAVFIKDRQGRFVYQNRRGYEACQVASEQATIGKRDHDFFPAFHADLYTKGDHAVMTGGEPMINRIEPAPDSPGGSELIVCSKYPLRDRRHQIIGVLCMYRRVAGRGMLAGRSGRIAAAVEAIHQRYAEPLTGDGLALLSGLSRRTFDAQFRRILGTTAHDYLLQVRINAATRLLTDTDRAVTEIALDVGFYDHSHFNRAFRQLRGVSPTRYRQQRQV